MTINCKGRLIDLRRPAVMGILNVTPDSFYDGGQYGSTDAQLRQAEQMLAEGATFIDVGGYSSRPGADEVSPDEERRRILPIIERISRELPEAIISVDTFRADIAREAVAAGAAVINDISAGDDDPAMFDTVAELQVPYILMHKQGTPKTMQDNPTYDDPVQDILKILAEKVRLLRERGVNDLIADPGFGFGKTLAHNYGILRNLRLFKALEVPVLAGVSRKSMINKVLNTQPSAALNGTTVVNTIALLNGADILRVHDVRPAAEAVKLVTYYNGT